MRYIYSLLLYLLTPFLVLRLIIRSRRDKAYRLRIAERFGFYPIKLNQCVWIHVVSVGEAIAATPFIQALTKRKPNTPFLITTTTPAGSQYVQQKFANQQVQIAHVYLPYDLPDAMSRHQN